MVLFASEDQDRGEDNYYISGLSEEEFEEIKSMIKKLSKKK